MSIATREAAESYPFKDSFTEHGNERTNLRREGYIAGRTAPVTKEEIDAAARVLWSDALYRRARHFGIVQDFDDLAEEDRQHLTHAAQAMLSAARKQVVTDEDC
jgi:hypothetical protein